MVLISEVKRFIAMASGRVIDNRNCDSWGLHYKTFYGRNYY